jgi:aminoglycoside 6'-N-acetyltransferase I
VSIRRVTKEEVDAVALLALMLWPDHTKEDLLDNFEELIKDENAMLFLVYVKESPIGFAQCQLRFDYVEGTESSPVGYLEGIYVIEEYRNQGIAKGLCFACEEWAREKGCTEFGSDVEIHNIESYNFHLKLGFKEANRVICFTKKI